MTVFKPIDKLANQAAELSVAIANNTTLNTFSFQKFFNGMKEVNTIQLDPLVLNADNIQEVIFIPGYYKK
jgi:ABC-type xylose transport system substrate-binding protein